MGRPREIHIEKGKKVLKDSPFVIANAPMEFKTQYFNIKRVFNEKIKGFGIYVALKDFKTCIIPAGLEFEVKEDGLLFFL
ncbi:hypothetical protein [Marinitoga lauensis]|uniref:hypothetical protein n=1 Tax=Marinitoga lauensis TaxID=2201189 RepID=UPI0010131F3B|nr:hypothetical protein [Marinitoga lauensis]